MVRDASRRMRLFIDTSNYDSNYDFGDCEKRVSNVIFASAPNGRGVRLSISTVEIFCNLSFLSRYENMKKKNSITSNKTDNQRIVFPPLNKLSATFRFY